MTGLGATAGFYANPIGSNSGSLSLVTQTNFPVSGSILTTFSVSEVATPEPSTFAMFGLAGLAIAFKFRNRKA